MQLFTLATIATAVSAFQLQTSSDNKAADKKFLTPVHEYAGALYLEFSDKSPDYQYDEGLKKLYTNTNSPSQVFGKWNDKDIAVGASVTQTDVTFDQDGTLNTGDKFWACEHFDDQYQYSQKAYLLRYGNAKPNADCSPVTIKRV